MDGEDPIICLAIWTLYKRRVPLTSDELLAVSIASRNKLPSRPRLFASQIVFGAILERFGEAKTTQKSMFGMLSGDVFFERVLASISGVFLEARNLKNQQKPLVFQWFLFIFTKSMFSKQIPKKLDFRSIFGSPNDEKSLKNRLEKYVFF